MAHFARLDGNNIVTAITVVSNDDIMDANGNENEALGIAVCELVVGPGPWVQTSYTGKFRKKYAGIGDQYVAGADVFYCPTPPFASWVLNDSYDWQPPIPKPDDDNLYVWDENSVTWVKVPVEEPQP